MQDDYPTDDEEWEVEALVEGMEEADFGEDARTPARPKELEMVEDWEEEF